MLSLLLIAGNLAAVAAESTTVYKTRGIASDPGTWQRVPLAATAPTNGVALADTGLFKPVMEHNIDYLLNSFSVNHMLVPFRERTGQKSPPDDKPQVPFWDVDLRGSSAGRFLMGAGNTVRWIDHPELHKRMNELIDGIESCREPNGYILAYPPDKTRSEEPNYGRAWFTHGLIEAAIAGNPKAYPLLRGHADWFNHWEMLPKLINCCGNAHQGHIASTRTFFSPIGKPEDLQVAEKNYVQDWWMNALAARQEAALWKYPLPTPHSYLITSFEAYLDHYRATGDKQYLDAMLGAWDMIHGKWEHVGGSMAICEGVPFFPPCSYYITPRGHTGETCGSVFWILFNQRFHLLYPELEKYAGEIEKSIYNVAIPNQAGGKGIRYHAVLEGHKENPQAQNSCCEGQGTRIYGSLAEFIYSVASDGIYVDLFEPSTIQWQHNSNTVRLTMETAFPRSPEVALKLALPQSMAFKLRVRVPSWATQSVPIQVNGKRVAMGHPGSYQCIDRTWSNGDAVSFALPMDFRLTRYNGLDQIESHERYALEYGPILLALVGPLDKQHSIRIAQPSETLHAWLKPKAGKPLHFTVDGHPELEYLPYWEVADQAFTCFPIIEPLSIQGAPTFLKSTRVEIVSHLDDTAIYYTTNGADPTPQSLKYVAPFEVQQSCAVKARLFANTEPKSEVATEAFTRLQLFAPSIHRKPGTNLIEMALSPRFPEAGIFYTFDGTEPTEVSRRYTQPLPVPAEKKTIRARSIIPGQASSLVVSFVTEPDSPSPWPLPDVPISDLIPQKATVGWNTLKTNLNIVGKGLSLAGKPYAKGVGVHAESELIYAVKPEYRQFVALVGIDDDTKGRGSVVFEVYADAQILYQTPILRPPQTWHITAAIPPGTTKLRLRVTDAGDNYDYDWGDWLQSGFRLIPE